MNCAKCQLIEMRVDKVKDGQIYYVCKNCGREEIVSKICQFIYVQFLCSFGKVFSQLAHYDG